MVEWIDGRINEWGKLFYTQKKIYQSNSRHDSIFTMNYNLKLSPQFWPFLSFSKFTQREGYVLLISNIQQCVYIFRKFLKLKKKSFHLFL